MSEDYRNHIFNEDCMAGLDRIPNGSVDLVMMDPPYQLDTNGKGCFGTDHREYHQSLTPISEGITDDLLDRIVSKMDSINMYVWCNKQQILQYLNYFNNVKRGGGVSMDLLTWHKTNPIPTCNNKYLSDTEYCLYFRSKGTPLYGSYETKRKWYVSSLNTKDKELFNHPTIKPLEFVRNLIGNSVRIGEDGRIPLVLDPFMGSGTTAVASKMLGFDYVGYEIDPVYCETAIRRVQDTPSPSEALRTSVRTLDSWGEAQ